METVMKKEDLFRAMEGIDEERLERSELREPGFFAGERETEIPARKSRSKIYRWSRTAAMIAACAAVVIGVYGTTQLFDFRAGSGSGSDMYAVAIGESDSVRSAASDASLYAEDSTETSDYWSGEYSEDSSGAESEAESEDATAFSGEKIVYSGYLEIQTLAYEDMSSAIRDRISEIGGFIESEYEYDGDYSWYLSDDEETTGSNSNRSLSITARIPSDQFESFMNSVGEGGKVISRTVNAENISAVYADKEATKEALEKEQERLLSMMDEAESMDDMIAIEARLSEVEKELNSYKTDLAGMDKSVEYSTVVISLEEVHRYTGTTANATFGERLVQAARDSIYGMGTFLQNLVLWIVRNAIAIAVIVVLIVFIVRKFKRKK